MRPQLKKKENLNIMYLWTLVLLSFAPNFALTVLGQEQARVVFLMPEMEMVSEVSQDKFDVYYVLKKEDFKENKKLFKDVPKSRFCFVDSDHDLEEMRKCLKLFQSKLKGDKFQYLVNGASEDEVMIAGILRSEYGVENGMKKEQAEIFVDKYKMKKKLLANDPSIPTAKFLNLKGRDSVKRKKEISKLNIPLIFKPTDKAGSEGVIIVRTLEELENAIQEIKSVNPNGEYIVEEFVEGPVMRIDGFVEGGKVKVAYPSYYNPSCFLYYRQGAPQVTHSDFSASRKDEYNSFTQAVISALELKEGPYHLEAIRSSVNGKLYFLEIGARPGGDSEFLTKFYNYPYDKIHVRSQVGLNTKTRLVPHTGRNGFAIVDCPTLPAATGTRQKLEKFKYDDQFQYSGLCDRDTILPKKGELFEVDETVGTLAQFFFKGPEKKVLEEGKRLRDSAKAVFTVWDDEDSGSHPHKKARKVNWPLQLLPR